MRAGPHTTAASGAGEAPSRRRSLALSLEAAGWVAGVMLTAAADYIVLPHLFHGEHAAIGKPVMLLIALLPGVALMFVPVEVARRIGEHLGRAPGADVVRQSRRKRELLRPLPLISQIVVVVVMLVITVQMVLNGISVRDLFR